MRSPRGLLVAGWLMAALPLRQAGVAHAGCWPPLNAIEQRQSNPVRIGDETFTTGFYSYEVLSYHVSELHCTESISRGPDEWTAIVGLGGNEPVGPQVFHGAPGGAGEAFSKAGMAPLPALAAPDAAPPPIPPFPALPPGAPPLALAPLPPLALAPTRELPGLPALAPLGRLSQSREAIPAPAPLPALPALSR